MSIKTYYTFPRLQEFLEIVCAALISSALVITAIGITDPGALPVLTQNLLA